MVNFISKFNESNQQFQFGVISKIFKDNRYMAQTLNIHPAGKSPQNLVQALSTIKASSQIIYYQFEGYFFIFFLIILAYFFYLLGKASVHEPIAAKAKNLQRSIKLTEQNKAQIPKNIQQINSRKKKILGLIVIACGVFAFVIYRNEKQYYYYILGTIGLLSAYWIFLAMKNYFLSKKWKHFYEEEKNIRMKVKEFSESLGPKVQQNLKSSLCREKILSKKVAPSQQCSKKQCIEYRGALKNRYEAIKHLTQSALNFDWCSICKKRAPFDELVRYQAKKAPKMPTDDQETQVTLRIKFMLDLLQDIDKWINQAGPCNCSKIYIDQIIHNKKAYSKISKQLGEKIKRFEEQEKAQMRKSTEQKMKKSESNHKKESQHS